MTDKTARNRLAEKIEHATRGHYGLVTSVVPIITATVVNAGWRPPARTVSTVEELDALPENAIVLDVLGTPHVHSGRMWIEGGFYMPDARTAEDMFIDVGREFHVVWEPEGE